MMLNPQSLHLNLRMRSGEDGLARDKVSEQCQSSYPPLPTSKKLNDIIKHRIRYNIILIL